MTTSELHIGVNLGLQKVASNIYDDFLSQEIDYFLNESVDEYIKEQYSLIKNEERDIRGQYVNENLRTLIATVALAGGAVVSYIPNSISFDLPNDYLYYIFSRTNNDSKWKNNRIVEPKGIKDYVTTDFNDPVFREFPVLLENDKIIVIGDSRETIDIQTDVHLTYIKQANTIDFDTSPSVELTLPKHTHTQIVDMTVNKLLTVIQGRRE